VLVNRSMPREILVPVLSYPSVPEAVDWLVAAFGFTRRWQAGDHRAQLGVGTDAAVAIVAGPGPAEQAADHVMVRVVDVDAHPREPALPARWLGRSATTHTVSASTRPLTSLAAAGSSASPSPTSHRAAGVRQPDDSPAIVNRDGHDRLTVSGGWGL